MINQIRIQNNREAIRYERFGVKLFRKALQEQAVNYDPQIMVNAYIEFYQFVFVNAASSQHKRLRAQEASTKDFEVTGFFLSTWKSWIKEWVLKNQLAVIAGVNENTLEQIRQITAESIELSQNTTTLQKKLIELVGSKSRALAIARTEGTRAYNMGTKRSAEDWAIQSGITMYKIWIHSGNPRDPRLTHINAQNKPIPREANFSIGGVSMEMPGDPRGGLGNIVNCSCTSSYLSERLARKLYPKSFE